MDNSQRGGNARWALGFIPLLVSVFVSCNIEAVAGAQHQVGGPPGWSLPSFANVSYTTWASRQTFQTGDTLYFNYSKANHNVLEVTEVKYDMCNASDPIELWDNGATVINLNRTGTFYYICGFPGHCEAGQKVAVTVGSSALSTTNGPAEAPTGSGGGSVAPGPASGATLEHPISALCGLLAVSLVMISVSLP